MDGDNIFRRLRGAVGNALVWGGCWSATALALFAPLSAVGFLPASLSWPDALGITARFGVMGAITGGAFSLFISLLYGGRRLSEISWLRFGIYGGVVAGVFVPVFLQTMNWLSGGGLVPMALVLDDAVWTAVFGGVAAGASLRVAQRADTRLPVSGQERLGALGSGDPLASQEARAFGQRSGVPQR